MTPDSSHATKMNATIVILAITAGILGYMVYEKYAPTNLPPPGTTTTQIAGSVDPGLYAEMTDVELVSSLPNSEEVSPEALNAYGVEADNRSVETDRVVIKAGCKVDPVIAEVTMGSDLVFQNDDDRPRTLQLAPDKSLVVPARGSKTFTVDFSTGSGMYGYLCDSQMVLVGMLVVR